MEVHLFSSLTSELSLKKMVPILFLFGSSALAIAPSDFQDLQYSGYYTVGSISLTSKTSSGDQIPIGGPILPGATIYATVPITTNVAGGSNGYVSLNVTGENGISYSYCSTLTQASFINSPTQIVTYPVVIQRVVAFGIYSIYAYITPYFCGAFGNQYLFSNIVSTQITVGDISPTPTPTPTPAVDLAVGAISINPANTEADEKPSVAPGSVITINVPISGNNILSSDGRSTEVVLHYGSNVLTQTVPLSNLSGGAIQNISFSVTFQPDDAGDQTLIAEIDSSNALGETNLANNTSSQLIHVLCKVADKNNGAEVPWFYQSQSPWGTQNYANQAPKKMSSLGCMVTSLAMLLKYYGIDTAADGTPMDPGSVNNGLNQIPLYSELGPQYASYSGYTSTGAVQPNGAVAFARNSYFLKCIQQGGDVEACLTASKSRVSYKFSIDNFTTSSQKIINKELCNGNPVILKVPSISSPNDKTKAHFVLATGMTVDAGGNAQYFTNNPAGSGGLNERRLANNEKIRGYRLYRPTSDPSMIFMHLAGNADMVITDPQGRRTGYNPITQQSYSEIPSGTYFTAESISDPNDANIFTPPETRFEGMDPVSGQYQVQVFAKSNTSYQLTSYSFDSTGTINGISDKKSSLKAGGSAQISLRHTADAIPVRSAVLNIKKADFYDSRHRDMAFLSGVIAPSDGHSISSIEKYLQVKVGAFTKSIEKKQLMKYKYRGHTMFTYGSFGKKGMLIELDADTGEFNLFIGNVDLDNGDTSLTADVMIQVDDVIAKNLVTFKEIRKKKSNDHKRHQNL